MKTETRHTALICSAQSGPLALASNWRWQHLKGLLWLTLALLLGGCASAPLRPNVNAQVFSAPPGRAVPGAATRRTVVAIARDMLGVRYRYGGDTPQHGFDCSGLVYYSYRRAGWRVPRIVREQYRHTRPIPWYALRPGDLVFFRIGRGHFVSHVGIYIGNQRFIHAPTTGQRVRIGHLNNRYWRRHFVRGGRFVDTAGS